MGRLRHVPIFLLLLVCFACREARAQQEVKIDRVSDTYAITNATLFPRPGVRIENGTVVIRDGLIHAVGTGIAIPPDAIVVKGDSLFVYAGFIDGLSHAGVSKDTERNESRRGNASSPEAAGITPQRRVTDALYHGDNLLRELRCAGFTAAHVVPYGNFLPGYGATIVTGGDRAHDMILAADNTFYTRLLPNQHVYPSTHMGLVAKWRELYRQAANRQAYEAVYASGNAGLPRPATDPEQSAFYPVLDRKIPVFFKAEKVLDIHRALDLRREFGFRILLGSVQEGWDVVDKVKQAGAGVFLSLHFPDEKTDRDHDAQGAMFPPDSSSWSDERARLEKRKAAYIHDRVSQAKLYNDQGVAFGFSTLGVKPEKLHAAIMRMMKAGLPEEVALGALTTQAAALLGQSATLGTLEKGKIANVTISWGNYFSEKSSVYMVFADGIPYECETKRKKNAYAAVWAGNWSMTTETPQGKTDLKVVIYKENDVFKGKISGGSLPDPTELSRITGDEKSLRFVYPVTVEGKKYDIVVEGKIDGRNFDGKLIVENYGTFPITGTKDPVP